MTAATDDEDIAAWVVALCEPLIAARTRSGIENRMIRCAQDDPTYLSWWFAGVTADVMATLPGADPWRSAKAGAFSGWQAGVDLVPPAHPNLFVDVGLAALVDPLPPRGRQVLARAADDVAGAASVLMGIAGGQDLVEAGGGALRWAAWRRRVYVGPEDPYVMTTGFGWLNRARAHMGSAELDREEWEAERAAATLTDDHYQPVKGIGSLDT